MELTEKDGWICDLCLLGKKHWLKSGGYGEVKFTFRGRRYIGWQGEGHFFIRDVHGKPVAKSELVSRSTIEKARTEKVRQR